MGPDTYAVAQAEQLLSLPAPPQTEIQRELLTEFLRNPFLDDDIQWLAVRTGRRRAELVEGLEALVAAGLLQDAGRRGFMLDLAALDPEIEYADKMLVLPEVEEAAAETEVDEYALADVLPFGVAILRPEGPQIMANAAIGRLLGLEVDALDAAAFTTRTGCDPALVCAAEAATTFPLEDSGLEVQVHPCQYAGAQAVLVVVQDQSLRREITQAHIQLQEELFAELRGEVAEPLQLIRTYLEHPEAAGLGTARAAFEQIEMFLQSFLLEIRSED